MVPITEQDEADMAAVQLDEGREMTALGARGPYGEEGYSTLARRSVFLCPCTWLSSQATAATNCV